MCIALAGAAAMLAGCASPPALAPSGIVDEITCENVDVFTDALDLARGRVPDGFVPVAVVDCLPFQSVEEQRTLVQPREALESGCAPTWAAQPLQLVSPERLDAHPAPSDGIQTIPGPAPRTPEAGEVDALLLCAYSTADAAAPTSTPVPGATAQATVRADDTAWFTGSRQLDAAQTRAVLEAAASAQPLPAPCAEIPGNLVVLDAGDGSAPITVELDGCRRLVVDYVTTYAAAAALVELLAG
jgi:hypothetical protein